MMKLLTYISGIILVDLTVSMDKTVDESGQSGINLSCHLCTEIRDTCTSYS